METRVITLFKRGAKTQVAERFGDEESGSIPNSPVTVVNMKEDRPTFDDMKKPPPMTDIFSWNNINYTIPVSGSQNRKLLKDIAGYVAPGKLTALMGETGAGKVRDSIQPCGRRAEIKSRRRF